MPLSNRNLKISTAPTNAKSREPAYSQAFIQKQNQYAVGQIQRIRQVEGPSIYDVHTEVGGVKAQVDACGRGGVKPLWASTQKIKNRVH